jgi:ribonuclease I
VRQIWDLMPFLAHYWPSWSSDNKAFWEHEWSRHGTCAALGGQHAFFAAVLRLHRALNIQVS